MDYTLSTHIWSVPPVRWERAAENEMSRRLHGVLLRWVPFAAQQYGRWEGRPNCGHFFGGTFWYQADSAHVSAIFATLSKLGEFDEAVTGGITQAQLKAMAISAIRYMGFTHDTGPADCVRAAGVLPYTSEKKWGGRGDSFFMASQNGRSVAAMACAAWLLWDDLDEETKLLVQNVTSSYADRWCDDEPRNGVYYDTQCEENAWTAAGISAALAMFPEHPHRDAWRKGFVNWSMNTISTFKDRLAHPSGLVDTTDGMKVSTVTFHPDYTSENHAFVHPSYYSAGTNLRAVHAVLALMSGQPVLDSALHNNVALYERTIKIWSQFDGLNVPVQGQDWWYNRQHERQLTHTILNVLHGHPDAARFARSALTSIESIQSSNSKGALLEENGEECVINRAHAQFAKDLEHGSAYDLVISYLLHAFGGPGAEPSEPAEMERRLAGVYSYPFGGSIIQRTPDTFTSFTWRNNVMALTLPAHGLWNVTPLYASYTGTLQVEALHEETQAVPQALSNEAIIRSAEKEQIHTLDRGFGAVVTLARGKGRELRQDVAFIALPDGKSVYVEHSRVEKPCRIVNWQSGTIGIRNERYGAMPHLAPGERTLYLESGSKTFQGFYGKEPDRIESLGRQAYVNMDNKIGYVLFGGSGVRYWNRHEYPKWKGVEDILTLNDRGTVAYDRPQALAPFAVVSLPNQTAADTAYSRVNTHRWETGHGDIELFDVDGTLAYASFAEADTVITAAVPFEEGTVSVFGGSYEIRNSVCTWTGRIAAYRSGYWTSRYRLEVENIEAAHLEVIAADTRTILLNRSDHELSVYVTDRGSGRRDRMVISPGAYALV
ncbi:hypothetical protein [Paenibacillus sp. HJGM_3]|uniref:hypothetical protein n=1 Tax=Paenibacillus sp. HJGM_3 TaxID=3379816 RepID=UPI003859446A